jgi:hypothetical protein
MYNYGVSESPALSRYLQYRESADIQGIYKSVEQYLLSFLFKIPQLRRAADAQIQYAKHEIDEKVGKLPPGVTSFRRIPKVGMSDEAVLSELEQYLFSH